MDDRTWSTQIATDLANLGVSQGDTILLHSSFKSLGPVPGGIETVIQGFIGAIGPAGTLLLPALTWALRPPDVFDVRHTPTVVGAIPEAFRTRAGTMRSVHPTHSVCGVGPRAAALLDDHRLDSTPCGVHSPFHKVVETSGKIVMLGCGLMPNTTMHALEEYAEPPYLFGGSYNFTLIDMAGNSNQREYKTHGFGSHGVRQRYDRVLELDTGRFMRWGLVLRAATYILDAPGLKTSVLERLGIDPWYFVERT